MIGNQYSHFTGEHTEAQGHAELKPRRDSHPGRGIHTQAGSPGSLSLSLPGDNSPLHQSLPWGRQMSRHRRQAGKVFALTSLSWGRGLWTEKPAEPKAGAHPSWVHF